MAKVWETFTNQKQWETYLKNLLKTNNKALLRALILIYQNQTDNEQKNKESTEENGIGFNKLDAEPLTKIAQKILKKKRLSYSELELLRIKLPKYWKQLMVISKINMQEQKLQDEELRQAENEKKLKQKEKEQNDKIYHLCCEYGQTCFYGICQECPYEDN